MSVGVVSGGPSNIRAITAKNTLSGQILSPYIQTNTENGSTDRSAMSGNAIVELSTNDKIGIYVANATSVAGIYVPDMVLSVTEI